MIGDYRRLNDIGKGSFAMVFRGVHAVSTLCYQILDLCSDISIDKRFPRSHQIRKPTKAQQEAEREPAKRSTYIARVASPSYRVSV
jgi:hypothetical protein